MGQQQISVLWTLLLLAVLSEQRDSRAVATHLTLSMSDSGGPSLPRRGLPSSGHSGSYATSGSFGGHARRLHSQTCIGVTGSGRIGCGLQWGLPSCCDSNPNTNSGYSCQPNTPFEGCPSGKYAACCTLF